MNFQNRINEILEENNLKQADLCRMTGIKTSLMSNYVTGKVSPTLENAILIADALKISLDALVGRDFQEELPLNEKKLSAEESELISTVREIDETDKEKVFEYAQLLYTKNFLQKESSIGVGKQSKKAKSNLVS